MGPEASLTISFVGTLAVRSELECFHNDGSICDGFRSESPGLGKVLIVGTQPYKVEPDGATKRRVGRTKSRDRVAGINPALVDAKVMLCLCVVVESNPCSSGKWHQPKRIAWGNAQWAGPDAGLIVANVFEALREMSHAAN